MILAAGRGERMRPLTDACPKPLLEVGGQPLIVWHLRRLAAAGFRDVVVNVSWLGQRIVDALGDGGRFGVRIRYSFERPAALETGGGIAAALPLLGEAPFLAVSGDIWTDYDFGRAHAAAAAMRAGGALAHLAMVPNPDFHPRGDYGLDARGAIVDAPPGAARLTFGNVGVYDPALFEGVAPGAVLKLSVLLARAIAARRITGEQFEGRWHNLGTPSQLAGLDAQLRAGGSSVPASPAAAGTPPSAAPLPSRNPT